MKFDYSEGVRGVLRRADFEAERVGHEYIGTEHILLALLAQDEGPAKQILTRLGAGSEPLKVRVHELLRPGPAARVMEARPYTSRAKKVLEYAMASARESGTKGSGRRGRVAVDTDHLLLGLIQEAKGIAAQALTSFGVTEEAVTMAARQLGGEADPGRRSGETPAGTRWASGGSAMLSSSATGDPVWFLQIRAGTATPIYEQIIAEIEEAVATSLLLPGERLPPVRDLAAELGVAPGTVARAYSALEQRGVLETEGARGTRVAERAPESPRARDVALALTDLLRPVAVAAYHMGARARDVHTALDSAMQDIFP